MPTHSQFIAAWSDRMAKWDKYFLDVCNAVASKSPCLSRKIGAIIVNEHSILATGYNGPPRGYPHCQGECPRKKPGYPSGEGLHLCPAAHAETNCLVNAARLGVQVKGAYMYLNAEVPCRECTKLIINAGLSEVIVTSLIPYHKESLGMFAQCNVLVRTFTCLKEDLANE